jgi:uncharacterized HAD superfamily protein
VKVGVDLDGVIYNFNSDFLGVLGRVSHSRVIIPENPFTTWQWPEKLGYTAAEEEWAWNYAKGPDGFWRNLPVYPDINVQDLQWLQDEVDLYFITNRPGIYVKDDTEEALCDMLPRNPTVLISKHKGLCCKALDLDYYIDDNMENCRMVQIQSPSTILYMRAQQWNGPIDGVIRTPSFSNFVDDIQDSFRSQNAHN